MSPQSGAPPSWRRQDVATGDCELRAGVNVLAMPLPRPDPGCGSSPRPARSLVVRSPRGAVVVVPLRPPAQGRRIARAPSSARHVEPTHWGSRVRRGEMALALQDKAGMHPPSAPCPFRGGTGTYSDDSGLPSTVASGRTSPPESRARRAHPTDHPRTLWADDQPETVARRPSGTSKPGGTKRAFP